jgi:hypothetical protein
MNRKLETILKDYHQMVFERNSLQHQLATFKGITAEEVIESMLTPSDNGERVRNSTVADETSHIAINYQERMHQINKEWYESLEQEFVRLNNEIVFFESAVASLPKPNASIMQDMVIRQTTWDELVFKYSISRMTLSRYRMKALEQLSLLYDRYMFANERGCVSPCHKGNSIDEMV